MTTQILKVKGMHCASCASIITKKLSSVPYINSVSVNYGNEKAKIDYDESRVFDRYSNIRHNIATKKIRCDMEHKILTNDDLDRIWGEY